MINFESTSRAIFRKKRSGESGGEEKNNVKLQKTVLNSIVGPYISFGRRDPLKVHDIPIDIFRS